MIEKRKVAAALLLVFTAPLFAGRSVDLDSLQKIEELWYVSGETEPFSGTATSRYEDGVLKSEIQYRDGLRHGKDKAWYPGGELKYVVRYKKGEIQSLGSTWYSREKPAPAPPAFVLCSEHPELGTVCGEADTEEPSRFEFCPKNSC